MQQVESSPLKSKPKFDLTMALNEHIDTVEVVHCRYSVLVVPFMLIVVFQMLNCASMGNLVRLCIYLMSQAFVFNANAHHCIAAV